MKSSAKDNLDKYSTQQNLDFILPRNKSSLKKGDGHGMYTEDSSMYAAEEMTNGIGASNRHNIDNHTNFDNIDQISDNSGSMD